MKLTTGFLGSPLFASELNHRSYIEIAFSNVYAAKNPLQLTLTGWVRQDMSAANAALLVSSLWVQLQQIFLKKIDHFLN
jgi:hypothetical protein